MDSQLGFEGWNLESMRGKREFRERVSIRRIEKDRILGLKQSKMWDNYGVTVESCNIYSMLFVFISVTICIYFSYYFFFI